MTDFAGKIVMITGAASGIGAAAAHAFASKGATLVLSDINQVALNDVADKLARHSEHLIEAVDVRHETEMSQHITKCITQFGQLDVAINNAGMCHHLKPFTSLTMSDYDQIMDINVKGVFLGMKHQLTVMKTQGHGSILNLSSAAGLVGARNLALYAASKHAVIGLTKSAADEVARDNIRVNALCPSFAATPLFTDLAEAMSDTIGSTHVDATSRITQRVPMKRLAQTTEIVDAMLWVCSDKNSFMTGQAISIDGGLTAI